MAALKPPDRVSVQQIRTLAQTIRRTAESFDFAADRVESLGLDHLFVFATQTGLDAMTKLSAFSRRIEQSIGQATIGKPIDADTRKVKNGFLTVEDEAAEIRGEMIRVSAQRIAKRKSTTRSTTTRKAQ